MRIVSRQRYFAIVLFCVSYVHQGTFNGPTAISRLDLLHSIFSEGTVRINSFHENTPDKAVFEGDFYSDKAPGTVALAFPPFLLAAGVLATCGIPLDSEMGWLVSSWVACAVSIGAVTALGTMALFAWLRRWTTTSAAFVISLSVTLGAAPLPYATMMFSHSLVVGLFSIALWGIRRQEEADGVPLPMGSPALPVRQLHHISSVRLWLRRHRWDLLTGHACGWALASEYTAGIIVVGMVGWMVRTGWTRVIPFALGALPPLLLIPGYSYLCFGNPFILPYSLQASFPPMKEGLYAIKWPDAETAVNLLLSPTRGLLFWSPFLAVALAGYFRKVYLNPPLLFLTYVIPALQIIVISGRVWDWTAGPTLGPRYLAPILPLLALPCALGCEKFPKTTYVLAGYSILITTIATLTDATPSGSIYNPLIEFHLPKFFRGEFSPNLGTCLGLPPFASVGLYYAILVGGIWWLWRMLPKEKSDSH